MSTTLLRLHGLLTQKFVDRADADADGTQLLDGHGLWLVITERGDRRYELRTDDDVLYVGDAKTMPLDRARRRALDMREARELDAGRMPYGRPLTPNQLGRFVNAWVSASIAAAAA